jgi:hypothetical protein
MADAANALQKAIYTVLIGDAVLTGIIGPAGIFDRRMTGRPMPYLVIAEIATTDIGPGAEEHILTIEAWSDAEGRKQVQTIADRVKALLHDTAPALSAATLVNLQHRTTRVRREPRTKAFIAEIVFRAVTE